MDDEAPTTIVRQPDTRSQDKMIYGLELMGVGQEKDFTGSGLWVRNKLQKMLSCNAETKVTTLSSVAVNYIFGAGTAGATLTDDAARIATPIGSAAIRTLCHGLLATGAIL
ncbi:unnamed protein product [Didymodactylos carnosus]|uniref:Uncharacterized protein n=1 Tax=Didymodactylos carnosus TaxID=1234261 RepID=A0A814ULI4_9BILA|nr:unnamed protein product [Didymodactylos carnosus]CAF3940448.1 unnamed protein product [Didymodactylos carnosus]